jgi:two-component system, LytTR family, response regulator LytT
MSGEKMNILLVEDDALNYLDVRDFLEDEGYNVMAIPGKEIIDNYDDAVAACETKIPHMAILDIEIKGKKDGLDIAKYIRDNFYAPVIILSGKNTDAYLHRAGSIGVNGYTAKVGKPYDLKQLHINIRMLLPQAEDAARLREESAFLHVKDFNENKTGEEFYIKRRIAWAALKLITTDRAPKNSVTLEMNDGHKYIYRASLTEFLELLPAFFVRINNFEVVNARFFDGKGKVDWVYFIGNKKYEIAPAYRTEKAVLLLNKLSP